MKQMMPAPDPVMQAVIEASFVPVDIAFGPPDNATALCQAHSQQKCTECDVDFITLNRLSTLLHMNPNLRCPPPPTATSKNLSVFITKTKEEGNVSRRALYVVHVLTCLLDRIQGEELPDGSSTLHYGSELRDAAPTMGTVAVHA